MRNFLIIIIAVGVLGAVAKAMNNPEAGMDSPRDAAERTAADTAAAIFEYALTEEYDSILPLVREDFMKKHVYDRDLFIGDWIDVSEWRTVTSHAASENGGKGVLTVEGLGTPHNTDVWRAKVHYKVVDYKDETVHEWWRVLNFALQHGQWVLVDYRDFPETTSSTDQLTKYPDWCSVGASKRGNRCVRPDA